MEEQLRAQNSAPFVLWFFVQVGAIYRARAV